MYPIQRTTAFAQTILSTSKTGIVHSVYRKTVNLRIDNMLLALQASGSPLSPISLITTLDESELSSLPLAAGQSVQIDSGEIHIQTAGTSIVFSLIHADTVVLSLTLFPKAEIPSLTSKLEGILMRSQTHGFRGLFFPQTGSDCLDETLILQFAQEKLRICTQNLSLFHYTTAAHSLSSLIGLGIGLTPSGDDFLCGVLAGFILRGVDCHPFAAAVREQIQQNLENTNDISRMFLHCALQGQFSEAVCSLTTVTSSDKLSAAFHAIGHSSGMDTLCGILYVLKLTFPG